MEVFGNENGDGGEPNDEGGIGVKEGRAVDGGIVKPALAHEKEPELVVPGGWKQGEQGCHDGCGHSEDLQSLDGMGPVPQ